MLFKIVNLDSCFGWPEGYGQEQSLTSSLPVEPGYQGGYFTLSEYYLSPTHLLGGTFRWMLDPELNLRIQHSNEHPYKRVEDKTIQGDNVGVPLQTGRWHDLRIDWDAELNVANLWLDERYAGTLLGLENARGIVCLRLRSAAATIDPNGLWVASIRSQPRP